MPLTIERQLTEDIVVLQLEGSLTLGPSLVLLRKAAREELANPRLRGIILDVHRIIQVDSSGLGELTIVYSSTNRHGCGMRLVGVSPNLQKMLQMTHLDAVLTSASEVETAREQLQAGVSTEKSPGSRGL